MEYSKDGRVIKGAPKAVVRSKYQEDVMNTNHQSVWGSFYDKRTGKWGYACCHSIIKMSYCTGEEGKKANEQYTSALAETSRPKPVTEGNDKEGGDSEKGKAAKLKTNLTVSEGVHGDPGALRAADGVVIMVYAFAGPV